MTSKARAGVLFLVFAAQISRPSAFLVQRDARNNDLAPAGVRHREATGGEELKTEIRDFVTYDNNHDLRIRNRDRKFYEDEIYYLKSLLASSQPENEKSGKGKQSDVIKKGFPKTYNKEESFKSAPRVKRQNMAEPNFPPHFVMPRSASYSTGFVNMQPNGPLLHHVAVNVPNFPPHHQRMQPFLAQNPMAAHPQPLPYPSSSVNNNPSEISHAAFQRSVLPNSREVNFQLLKSVNGGGDIERAPRTFSSARNSPASMGRADLPSNLLGERFQTIDGNSPFGAMSRQIGQNLDRSRIQMLEQQINVRDERIRLLEQELLTKCNRRPDIFTGGRQSLPNNFEGFPSLPGIGLLGRPNSLQQMPMRELDLPKQLPGLVRPLIPGRSQPRSKDPEDEYTRPLTTYVDEGTEQEQIQKAKEFDFNKVPVKPSNSEPTDSVKASSFPIATSNVETPKKQTEEASSPESAIQPKSANENNEPPIPSPIDEDLRQFVDGQWLPPANQQTMRNSEGIPYCIPVPGPAPAPAPVPAPEPATPPKQRNNDEQEIPGKTQDLDKDQQKIVLETLQQAVKPLMKSIDAIKENGLEMDEPVASRPIPKLKDILASRAPLPLPRMPAFRSRQDGEEVSPGAALPLAPPNIDKEVPSVLANMKALGDNQARGAPNLFRGTESNEPRPLMDALERMRSNRKEMLQDLAGNLKPLERPGLLGLKRPPLLDGILGPAAVEKSIVPVENNEGSQLPVQNEFDPSAIKRTEVDQIQPVEVFQEKLGEAVASQQPILTKSVFDTDAAEEDAKTIASPKKSPTDDSLITNEEIESPGTDSPRAEADEIDDLNEAPSEATIPRAKTKTQTKPGKDPGMMDLDTLRESVPTGAKDKSLKKIVESATMSPRENEPDLDDNLVDTEMAEGSPMARNKEAVAVKETVEPSICQKIIKEVVAMEMEMHAKEDANPAMFINKNFTSELMKRVNTEIAKYQQEHATDGLDHMGTCDDADMKLEIVSQVLLMLNQWIQEVPITADAGPNSLTAGQISELKNLLDS